jgi:hypothetical protein
LKDELWIDEALLFLAGQISSFSRLLLDSSLKSFRKALSLKELKEGGIRRFLKHAWRGVFFKALRDESKSYELKEDIFIIRFESSG